MTQTDQTLIDNEESSEQATTSTEDSESEAADACSLRESESVEADVRTAVLERDGYRCQVCGRRGPEQGGLATLHVHHIERDPDTVGEDSPANLTTLCRSCHSWVHQQSSPDEAPVTLSEADLSVLLPQDIEILRFLAEEGPAKTGEIRDALTADLSVTAVRERLAVLMGLDTQVESRDRQIVDQDVETGAWGLVEQIEHSARGHIPTDPQALIQRVEDELVRQALDRGCDRDAIMSVLDISRRTTFHREKRAYAYDFPLDAFRGGGGRPTHDERAESTMSDSSTGNAGDAAGQQQLSTVADGDDAAEASQQDVSSEIADSTQHAAETDDEPELTRAEVEAVMAVLERLAADL
jgi:hypothetical protein